MLSCAVTAELQPVETQSTARSIQTSKTANTISSSQKPDQYYQQQYQSHQPQLQRVQLQESQQSYPVQYIPSPIYQQQQPQPAMIIIAQQPPVPHQSTISQAAQQLLSYFNANPQARYQFLQGNYNPQPQQPAYVPQQSLSPAYSYQIMPVQQQYQQIQSHQTPFVTSPQVSSQAIPIQQHQILQQVPQHSVQTSSSQESYGQTPHFQLPIIGPFGHSTHIPHVAALAQLTTQKYLPQVSFRPTSPAIVTGLENFTPEQQAQIKAQLQSGGPITPLRSNIPPSLPSSLNENSSALKSASTPVQNTSPQEFPAQDEDKSGTQQGSQQTSTSTNYNSGYNSQFSKG